MQVVNLLNADYADAQLGSALAESVLATLTALLAGNEASRRRLQADVGYDQIQAAVARQVCACAQVKLSLAHVWTAWVGRYVSLVAASCMRAGCHLNHADPLCCTCEFNSDILQELMWQP